MSTSAKISPAMIAAHLRESDNGRANAALTSSYIEPIAAFLAEEDPPTQWIFPDLLPTDVLMLIHGEPRARKSLVGFELALAAATGTAPFGLHRFKPATAIDVLYVQEEDTRSLTRPRLRRLVQERCAANIPDTLHVSVRRGISLDDPEWVTRITDDVKRLRIRFLVFAGRGDRRAQSLPRRDGPRAWGPAARRRRARAGLRRARGT